MKTIRCKKCKRMYEYEGLPPKYCAECYIKEEEQYQIVRTYIKAHQGATVQEVSDTLNVPQTKILQYLREERLEVADGSSTYLSCAGCGQTINTGIYCDTCKKRYDPTTMKTIGKVVMGEDQMFYKTDMRKEGSTSSKLYKRNGK